MRLLLPIHSYTHRARQFSWRRLVNCYPEQASLQAKAPVGLMRAPGVATCATLATSPLRGLCAHAGSLYAVAGMTLYRVLANGSSAALGTIPGTGRVSMASNGAQLIIVAEPYGYVWDGTLAQITDEDFTARGASAVAVVDSFALFIEPHSGRFFHSDLLAATAYDSLNFATAEGSPDELVSILVDHRQVFLFGEDSTELWADVGGAGSPFAREANGFIETGCGGRWIPTKADNTVFWVSPQRIAYRLTDLTPQRISTHAVEQKWQTYSRIDDACGFAFVHEGHTFWSMTFPSGGDTFVY